MYVQVKTNLQATITPERQMSEGDDTNDAGKGLSAQHKILLCIRKISSLCMEPKAPNPYNSPQDRNNSYCNHHTIFNIKK
jgi:hypothetical protein